MKKLPIIFGAVFLIANTATAQEAVSTPAASTTTAAATTTPALSPSATPGTATAESVKVTSNELDISREAIAAIYADAKLPPHPLVASGYLSVGCMPCSSRTAPGEDARAGRWRGKAKTECGIHTTKTS